MTNDVTTNPFDDDKLKEECGIFAIFSNNNDASTMTALGLHALQHRGQEASGIVSYDGEKFYQHRGLGLVDEALNNQETIATLKGHAAIGHNRYATTGGAGLRNVQPLFAEMAFGGFGIAHNGNLTNALKIRDELVQKGSIFQSTTDTEVIIHLVALSQKKTVMDRFIDAVSQIEGAYSLVAISRDQIMGMRDPHGVRPLVLGRLGKTHVLASETCALDIIGAEFIRDIEPGELVVLNDKGIQSFRPLEKVPGRLCIFEYVYFARPDSNMDGRSVYSARKKIGEELAKEAPCDADVIVPVPDSGVPSAIGYAQASGLPFELGIIRNHYVGRTFIQPTQQIRHLGVKRKHNANRGVLEGKRVVLVDDSIVRGTTSRKIVEMVRAAGATEVHMRISSPPTKHPCFYGIDTPSSEELLAHTHDVEQIREFIGVDSLAYISVDGLYRAVGEDKRNDNEPQFCDACFTGEYPIALTDQLTKSCSGQIIKGTDLPEPGSGDYKEKVSA